MNMEPEILLILLSIAAFPILSSIPGKKIGWGVAASLLMLTLGFAVRDSGLIAVPMFVSVGVSLFFLWKYKKISGAASANGSHKTGGRLLCRNPWELALFGFLWIAVLLLGMLAAHYISNGAVWGVVIYYIYGIIYLAVNAYELSKKQNLKKCWGIAAVFAAVHSAVMGIIIAFL